MRYSFRPKKQTYRSGLEDVVAKEIEVRCGSVCYERKKLAYIKPVTEHTYTPDFILPNGIVIETKGEFSLEDRKKHLLIKQQYPDLDLRFVFSNPNSKIRKGSPTTYAMWCEAHGFLYAEKTIPQSWYKEPTKKNCPFNLEELFTNEKRTAQKGKGL